MRHSFYELDPLACSDLELINKFLQIFSLRPLSKQRAQHNTNTCLFPKASFVHAMPMLES
jgi:hypothetical protein